MKKVIDRREQIGSGDRSEYRRTYNTKSNTVTDHLTNKTTSLKKFMKGELTLIC